ncbi:MAG: hypothetical protein JW996_03520 [Candidatus Cloacimonetes bacterium]|nr:hypothetical protein [Candidatus Cloacimonadota bacterium]
MFKWIIIISVLFIPFFSSADDIDVTAEAGFSMGGAIGTMVIGDDTYSQIRFMPELVLGKFGIGLDIELLIDSNGKIREEDWDNFGDYLNKIYYIRYGLRGDPFYFRVGGFPYYTLGHGLIMKNYSNMLRYPEFRQIGLQLGGKIPVSNIELEAFSSNLETNEILAGRITIEPLSSTEITLLNKLKFGGTIVTDRDQYGKLDDDTIASLPVDTDGDGIYDDDDPDLDGDGLIDYDWLIENNWTEEEIEAWLENNLLDNDVIRDKISFDEDGIIIFGADYTIPLVESKLFSLGHYGEAAKIVDHNMGFIFPGFYSKFLIFDANLEFRFYQDDFLPGYFDHLYDDQRCIVVNNEVFTKESLLEFTTELKGWFGSLTADLFNMIYLTVSYEDMYGEDDYNYRSIWGKVNLAQKLIPKLVQAEVNYSQTGFDKLRYFKAPSAQVNGILAYSLGSTTRLVAKYQERYSDFNGNGRIKGKEETIKSMNVGVEFRF